MATPTYPSTHRSQPAYKGTGDYNKITKVASSTTFHATGSNAGAAFICEDVSNVVIHAANGGTIPGTALTADTLYPIGTRKVVIGSSGVVYVLHR
jgi:hypothetical protein|tara:strand:- start:183 stop:467 length:285 start_codon:yes stop_codon:yes gene_type:complete